MASTSSGRDLVILVVEDEPILLLHAAGTIEDAGFQALQAANADEAIGFLERYPQIRVVFTDIDMPGSMDGRRLALAVRDRWPPIEIILTSGHASITVKDMPSRCRFLPKPYNEAQLIGAIEQLTA